MSYPTRFMEDDDEYSLGTGYLRESSTSRPSTGGGYLGAGGSGTGGGDWTQYVNSLAGATVGLGGTGSMNLASPAAGTSGAGFAAANPQGIILASDYMKGQWDTDNAIRQQNAKAAAEAESLKAQTASQGYLAQLKSELDTESEEEAAKRQLFNQRYLDRYQTKDRYGI